MRCWTPRRFFPPSSSLSDRLFTCGSGFYLSTNPDHGEGDPVYAVGWAESDYWARRAWEVPFEGELTAPPAQWGPPPSLAFLGRPDSLSFADVYNFELAQPGSRKLTLVTASFRFTDSAFLYSLISGVDGINYSYASDPPKPADQPVAIEFRLSKLKYSASAPAQSAR